MPKIIHALFVGIAAYPPPASILSHTVKKGEALYKLIKNNINEPTWKSNFKIIKNADATYKRIITELETFSKICTKEDAFLFYYAGHGSNEPIPKELRDKEKTNTKEHTLENLFCVDSRSTSTAYELADKELAYLIAPFIKKGVHFAAIMDCCHSGDNTRLEENGLAVTTVSSRLTPRPMDAFYGYKKSPFDYPPQVAHLQMAACASHENAADGVFTQILINVLKAANPGSTYKNIMDAVIKKMQDITPAQTPILYPTLSQYPLFLNGAIKFKVKA